MASADFMKLTEMIYIKRWHVSNRKFVLDEGNEDWRAEVTLENNGQSIVLSSSAVDFVQYVFQIQKIVDGKGSRRLAKIRDSDKYWAEVEKLEDPNGEKVASAIEAIRTQRFKFDFNPIEGIRKTLRETANLNDPDVRGVKSFYHEVLAQVLLESRQHLSVKEQPEKTNSVYATYASLYEEILRKGFMSSGQDANPFADYRRYLDLVQLDLGDLMRRIHEQVTYTEVLRQLLVDAGNKVEPQHGVRCVLDAYWRMCELCYPFLDTARIAIELCAGKTPSTEELSFEKLVTMLRSDENGKKLVKCVEPVLRNSEAHCAAGVVLEDEKQFVVAYESRSNPAREIARFPYEEVRDKTICLKRSAVVAFYLTLVLFEYGFLILVMNSDEFRYRLATLGQI
jgi:hypothetical protein